MAVERQTTPRRGAGLPRMTVQEYLAFEQMSAEKHEYVDGWVSPVFPTTHGMAGGTNNHGALTSNVSAALHGSLRTSPCMVYSPDVRVLTTATTYRYPDVTVTCDVHDLEAGDRSHIASPCLVVEVLSEGTQDVDRIDKLAEYRAMPSVQDYLLVGYTARLVEHYHRAGDLWTYRAYGSGETIALETVGMTLAVDQVYAKVRLPSDRDATSD